MQKTLSILTLLLFSLCFISAQNFTSVILDSGQAYLNPSVTVNKDTGLSHFFWSNGSNIFYSDSTDKFTPSIVYSGDYNLGNLQTVLDSKGNVHMIFSEYKIDKGVWKYYYINSIDWKAIDLNVNYFENKPSLAISQDDIVYIALIGMRNDEDIVILSSSNYTEFNYQWLNKPSIQLYPSIGVDSKGVIHVAWWDWRDGVIGNCGAYKVMYSNSLDNFESEKVISLSNQSYSPDLKVNKNEDKVYIAFKDTGSSGLCFDGGYIYIYDVTKESYIKVTTDSRYFMQDRPLGFAIDSEGINHLVWSELKDSGKEVYIYYTNSINYSSHLLQDIGYKPYLGYIAIDSSNGSPIIMANIHSIAEYEIEKPSLEDRITELELKIQELENRVNLIEGIINYMKQFSLFKEFFTWIDSPKECFTGEKKCDGSQTLKCVNYAWKVDITCQYGCSAGVCNSPPGENCLTKPDERFCNGAYSGKIDYTGCKIGQGTATNCNIGQCSYIKKSYYQWCGSNVKCDSILGLCRK